MASQARVQPWLTPCLRSPPPPPPHHGTRRPVRSSQLCPVFSHTHYSAMLSTQPCPHPRSFSINIGSTTYRPDAAQLGLIQHGNTVGNRRRVGRATRISCLYARNPRGGGGRNPFSPRGMHSSLAIVIELGGKRVHSTDTIPFTIPFRGSRRDSCRSGGW